VKRCERDVQRFGIDPYITAAMDVDPWRVEYDRLYPEGTVDGVQLAHHAVDRRPPVAADQTCGRIRQIQGHQPYCQFARGTALHDRRRFAVRGAEHPRDRISCHIQLGLPSLFTSNTTRGADNAIAGKLRRRTSHFWLRIIDRY